MSQSAETDEPGVLTRAYRTVTPEYVWREDVEMDVIGWSIFLGIVVLLVPLLPFLVIVWLVGKVLDVTVGTGETEE